MDVNKMVDYLLGQARQAEAEPPSEPAPAKQ
jgi:hypothetical protein